MTWKFRAHCVHCRWLTPVWHAPGVEHEGSMVRDYTEYAAFVRANPNGPPPTPPDPPRSHRSSQ